MKARSCLLLLTLATPALADPETPVAATEQPPGPPNEPAPARPPPARPLTRDHSGAEVDGAPVPGQESGRLDRVDPGDSSFRTFARGALFVPKLALDFLITPVRGGLWAEDRYQLQDLYYRTFYNEDRTIGLFPTAAYQTGFGVSVGARLVDKDTFGEGEYLAVDGTWGGTYRASASAWLTTGRRLGPLEIGAGGNFDRRPHDSFWGIGNADEGTAPAMPIDPLATTTAVEGRYRYQESRVSAAADVHVMGPFHVVGRGALTELKFANSTNGVPVSDVYDTTNLIGFMDGVQTAYGEGELVWDTRDRASIWEPNEFHTVGTLVRPFAGFVHRLDHGPDFWHYGLELQQYFHIAPGPRAFALRFSGEGVTGERNEVPFVELPYLGGDLLRGYMFQRFRDRIAAFATAEYMWDVAHYADAYVFADAGRVWESLDALSLDHLRVGFGVGLEVHSESGFLAEFSLASSVDGGVIVTASFNPVFNQRPRWR